MMLRDEQLAGALLADIDATYVATAELRQTLNQQTAQLAWRDLQRFFAQGRVIWVRGNLDMVEIAQLIVCNDAARIASAITTEKLILVPDNQAQQWCASEAWVWAVVVKPWVLVQDLADHVTPN